MKIYKPCSDPAASDRQGARQTERSARPEVFASYSGVALPAPEFLKKQVHSLERGLFQASTAVRAKSFWCVHFTPRRSLLQQKVCSRANFHAGGLGDRVCWFCLGFPQCT
ncbi:MAG: hypothetical protein KME35_10440 [Aphanocapsa sp. GSE-SYN-MK-11-07L]|nr:hypothetical protein [Aphanocapsa sp. GSE-SYN-MK-11-07L]